MPYEHSERFAQVALKKAFWKENTVLTSNRHRFRSRSFFWGGGWRCDLFLDRSGGSHGRAQGHSQRVLAHGS